MEPVQSDLRRSSRDYDTMRSGLERSLAEHLGGSGHRVTDMAPTSATGMSSETMLFDATWHDGDGERTERLVARVAPADDDVPVFPSYDLPGQFQTISTVAERTNVPVPRPRWCEPDPTLIGSPFFVMDRVDGEVPPDVLPYNFGDSWLFHASPAEQRRLQDGTVAAIAGLHAIEDPTRAFPHLAPGGLRAHLDRTASWYRFASASCGPSRAIEAALGWLERNQPVHESANTFCWGDSRIGNVMYRDFGPVAVLDWEMANIGPPEADVAWLIHAHRMFEDMASQFGFPGMPDFMRTDDVVAEYTRITGRELRDLDWYLAYSAVQLGIVFLRTGHRSVHFGERAAPGDADELVMNLAAVSAVGAG